MNNEGIEVEDTYKVKLIVDGIIFIIVGFIPLISLLISFIIMPESINEAAIITLCLIQILTFSLNIPLFIHHLKKWYPVYRVKCQISIEKIGFYIQNRIYFEIKWNDINRIEFIRESYASGMGSDDTYKVRIFSLNKMKDIRLYALRFRFKNAKLILSKLEEISTYLKIRMTKISELKEEAGIYRQQYEDQQDVLKFYKDKKL